VPEYGMPWWRFIPCGKHCRDPHRSSLKTVAGEVQNLHRVSHEYVRSALHTSGAVTSSPLTSSVPPISADTRSLKTR
jgi:hypothetical protein